MGPETRAYLAEQVAKLREAEREEAAMDDVGEVVGWKVRGLALVSRHLVSVLVAVVILVAVTGLLGITTAIRIPGWFEFEVGDAGLDGETDQVQVEGEVVDE